MFHFRAFYDFFGGADESFLGIKLQLKLGIFTGRFIIIFFYCQKTLEREIRSAHWTDCDREGENIGFEVIDVWQAANRNLRRVFRSA